MQQLTLGVDVACRASHQASLADATGRLIWSGRRFRTTVEDLARLWAALPAGVETTVVMEPTATLGCRWRRGSAGTAPG
jgi:hypothetical protein